MASEYCERKTARNTVAGNTNSHSPMAKTDNRNGFKVCMEASPLNFVLQSTCPCQVGRSHDRAAPKATSRISNCAHFRYFASSSRHGMELTACRGEGTLPQPLGVAFSQGSSRGNLCRDKS